MPRSNKKDRVVFVKECTRLKIRCKGGNMVVKRSKILHILV